MRPAWRQQSSRRERWPPNRAAQLGPLLNSRHPVWLADPSGPAPSGACATRAKQSERNSPPKRKGRADRSKRKNAAPARRCRCVVSLEGGGGGAHTLRHTPHALGSGVSRKAGYHPTTPPPTHPSPPPRPPPPRHSTHPPTPPRHTERIAKPWGHRHHHHPHPRPTHPCARVPHLAVPPPRQSPPPLAPPAAPLLCPPAAVGGGRGQHSAARAAVALGTHPRRSRERDRQTLRRRAARRRPAARGAVRRGAATQPAAPCRAAVPPSMRDRTLPRVSRAVPPTSRRGSAPPPRPDGPCPVCRQSPPPSALGQPAGGGREGAPHVSPAPPSAPLVTRVRTLFTLPSTPSPHPPQGSARIRAGRGRRRLAVTETARCAARPRRRRRRCRHRHCRRRRRHTARPTP